MSIKESAGKQSSPELREALEVARRGKRWSQAIAVAALVIIGLQVGIMVQLQNSGAGAGGPLSLASGAVNAEIEGARLLVAFQEEAEMADVTALLGDIGGNFVEGPSAGMYILKLNDADDEVVETILRNLNDAEDLILFAGREM